MVSSDEIRLRLKAKRTGSEPDNLQNIQESNEQKGYLVCEQCSNYYELQMGESPEDFSPECDCGGHLVYQKSLNAVGEETQKSNSSSGRILAVLLGIGIVFIIIMLIFPFIQLVFITSYYGAEFSSGLYFIMFLVLALVFSGIFTGYYLIKIILRANR